MYLVLIETSGNQNYIFATNKLRENVGASEITYRAGTQWVLEAVAEVTDKTRLKVWQNGAKLRQDLLNPDLNPPINEGATSIEIILAASGKALLLVENKEDAQAIIRILTQRSLKEAPGLELTGVYQEFDWHQELLGPVNKTVHQQFEAVRAAKPSGLTRFSRIPIEDECRTSGLPAQMLSRQPGSREMVPISQLSHVKQVWQEAGKERVNQLVQKHIDFKDYELAGDNNDLEKAFDQEKGWLAIVHADGNGLGEIFLKFHEHIGAVEKDQTRTPAQKNRDYVDQLRKFSLALDVCTEKAFLTALKSFLPLKQGYVIPLVPLILGGDDLTVVCDGRYGIRFTRKFLQEFEKETQNTHEGVGDIVAEVAEKAFGVRRLSACAGVAIVKPHFPFSVGYELAEALIKVAKTVKNCVQKEGKPYPCSALDFHIVLDSSDVTLGSIRRKLDFVEKVGEKDWDIKLYNRPYVTSLLTDLSDAEGKDWAEFHHWDHLQSRINILLKRDKGQRILPNSQIHDLRTGLFQGKQAADARYRLIRERYPELKKLVRDPNSLFIEAPAADRKDKPLWLTALLDSIDSAELIGSSEVNEEVE
ncbi:MAG: hypothetical protein OHK0012_08550 [Synechococcales cyanobacterium]